MKPISRASLLAVFALGIASCGTFTPQPTATLTPTETSLPTSTFTPEPTHTPTHTPIPPTNTSVPPTDTPSAPTLPIPQGEPVSEWEGIPVMPNALAGDGDPSGYSFIVPASRDEVQQFYVEELVKLGWQPFASGESDNGAVILMFMNDSGTLSISIIPQPDGTMYVLLV